VFRQSKLREYNLADAQKAEKEFKLAGNRPRAVIDTRIANIAHEPHTNGLSNGFRVTSDVVRNKIEGLRCGQCPVATLIW
jgi:hypothetical protein